MPCNASNLQDLWREWVLNSNVKTEQGASKIILFSASLWEIWRWRCSAVYGDERSTISEWSFLVSSSSLIKLRLAGHLPKLKAPSFCPTTKSLRFEASLPPVIKISQFVPWKPALIGVTANVALYGQTAAFILRSAEGNFINAGSCFFNPTAFLSDLDIIFSKVEDFAALAEVSLSVIQCDQEVGNFVSRKWAASLCSVPCSCIRTAANGAARSLARLSPTNIDSLPAAFLSFSFLPAAVLSAVAQDRLLPSAGLHPSAAAVPCAGSGPSSPAGFSLLRSSQPRPPDV